MGGPQTLKLGDGFTTRDNKNWNVTCYTGHRPWTIILKGNLKRNRMGTGRDGLDSFGSAQRQAGQLL